MSKIRILPENIANKIAAGEVVQRPESVVKELLENAIDAGATAVELLLRKAGKSLIQVIDNGEGMTEEDAVLSIQKHATSKISQLADLDAIRTLGFRGEALSSIAAVSQLEIRTETPVAELGSQILVDDGGGIRASKGSYPKGTSVSVKNLFYNVPARRNFLKTDPTELRHCLDSFRRVALSHPQVAFKLWLEDELFEDFPAGTLEDRMRHLFGEEALNTVIPASEYTEFLSLTGYIGKPVLLKKNKGDQYLFINNRFVVSKQISHAVYSAYEHLLEKGDYPFYVLFLTLDPSRVDVNVHPSKLEIRFDNEKDVYSFVLAVVRKALASHDLVPSVGLQARTEDGTERLSPVFSDAPAARGTSAPSFERPPRAERPQPTITEKELDLLFGSLDKHVDRSAGTGSRPFDATPAPVQPQTAQVQLPASSPQRGETSPFIVQLQNKYILCQIRSGLMIIDQHVAQERILYEKAMRLFEANLPFTQPLLFPKTIELDASRFLLVREILPYLSKLGFELELFSKSTVVLHGVPSDIRQGTEEGIINELLDEYLANQQEKKVTGQKDNIAKSYACKASIKAGDRLSEDEMRLLIDQLFATQNPYTCPHGRPVVVRVSMDELDKRFGRS